MAANKQAISNGDQQTGHFLMVANKQAISNGDQQTGHF
jgi:hypothetical protein